MVLDLAIHSLGELIFVVFFIVSVMISLYAFYSFLSQRGPLKLQLTQIETELDLLRPKLPKQRLKVRLVRRKVPPLHQKRQVFSNYFRILQDIIRDFDLREMEQERLQKDEKKKRFEAETGKNRDDLFEDHDD